MEGLKVTKDGFVWKLIGYDTAKTFWYMQVAEIYRLYDDDSEALIESVDELNRTIRIGLQIGVEIGFIKDMEKEWNRVRQDA